MKRGCLSVAVAVFVLFFVAVSSLLYVLLRYQQPGLAHDTFVEIPIGGAVPDYNQVEGFLTETPMSMRELLDVIRLAEEDPNIEGVVLRLFPLTAGWAKAHEIREAVVELQQSGKQVVAYIEMGGDKEYYIATAADRIVIPPMSSLDVNGISMMLQFYGGTLDKVGVQYDGVAVGKYKSAPEHYTRRNMSDAYQEETDALVDGLYARYVTAVSLARDLRVDQVLDLIDAGPYDAVRAKEAGLVDEVLYRDEFLAWVKDQGRDRRARLANAGRLRERARRQRQHLLARNRIAVLYVQGAIVSGESQSGWRGSTAGDITIADALEQIREDSRIRAVVIRVNSPGGSVLAADNMWREIALTRQEMPVIISMGDVAASGGYYIAAAGDEIVAEPQTITGSIGIFTGKYVVAELYEKVGLATDGAQRGKHADLYSMNQLWTAEERDHIQSELNDLYDVFVRKVAEGRQMDVDKAREVAQGRVWLGATALEHGLVDELGGLDLAIELAKERAQLLDTSVGIEVFPRQRRLLRDAVGRGLLSSQIEQTVPEWAQTVVRQAPLPFDDGEPLALLPFEVQAE